MNSGLTRLLVLLAATASLTTAHAQQPVIRIQEFPGIITTLARVAIEKGYCAKRGIECRLQTIPSAPAGVQALLSNGIEVAVAPSEVAVQSAARGADLKIIAGFFNVNPFMLFLGKSMSLSGDKKYPDVIKDLKGKKVGVTARGAGPEFQVKTMLLAVGLRPDDVTFVAVGSPNTAYPALVNQQVDAVMTFVPFDGFCDVLKTCRIAVVPAKGEGPPDLTNLNGAGALYVVRGNYLSSDRKTIDSFVDALRDAERFVASPANMPQLMQITLKYYRIEIPKGDEVLQNSLERFRSNFVVDYKREAVQSAADYLLKTGQLNAPFDASRLF